MENANQLINNGNPETMKFGSSENPVQGLYYDLLACIGGGDHPSLPQGYKMKPMTGFLNIVEAFNDVAKLNSAGSGIVCEVGSKEFAEGQCLASKSGETLKTRTLSSAGSDISESLQTILRNEYDSRPQSSADINNMIKSKSDHVNLSSSNEGFMHQSKEQRQNFHKQEKSVANQQLSLDEKKTPKNDDNSQDESTKYENVEETHENLELFRPRSSYIEEVGPPLKISDLELLDPVHQEYNAMEKEMQKYSEELRKIERILKEQLLITESASIFSHRQTPTTTEHVSESKSNTEVLSNSSSMIQTIIDGLISPSCALEMMYEMESNGSTNLLNASTYQSCTSFHDCQNPPTAGNCLANLNLDASRKASSIYMECSNNADDGNGGNDHLNPSFISEHVVAALIEQAAEETDQSACEFADCEDGNQFPTEMMMNKLTPEDDTNNNDVSYYSVDEDSDAQGFTDAEDSIRNKKGKRKIRFSDKSSRASTDDERLWTSASGSECDDDVSEKYKVYT